MFGTSDTNKSAFDTKIHHVDSKEMITIAGISSSAFGRVKQFGRLQLIQHL